MTDKELIKQEIKRLFDEYPMSRGILKHLTIFIDSLPEEFASVETNCTTCTNDKGCITCENGELHESINKAEQKALEAYPIESYEFYDCGYKERNAFKQGYEQAMQDFLDKTEEFLYLQLNNGLIECGNIERLIEQFKNYMQDE